ncbi:hypothetical protein M405DRAFT_774760 [Rhizopogon salebrosus TDB-379]|nr:hypothetical protein M405DRAFT_774760 [Rhizopogon salebrosus TDB-379]
MIVLTLSSEIRNTVITNRQGMVVYKTNTPEPTFDWLGTTTIYKPKPNADQYDTSDQFEVMGEIEWHIFRPSKFRFGGNEVEAKRFIERRGLMGRKRVFTGPDGRSYRWDMVSRTRVVVLSLNDGSRTVVARSHRVTGRRRKATLEISPTLAPMMDVVILTFVFVEKLRMEKEQVLKGTASLMFGTLAALGGISITTRTRCTRGGRPAVATHNRLTK